MKKQFYKLPVKKITKQTSDAVSITLDLLDNLREIFTYKPGQHIVFRFTINGKEYRRSYSLNTNPYIYDHIEVTVKRIKNGLVSNYVNDQLEPGTEVEVMPPTGNFIAEISPQNYKHYYLFAAGSGITPIFSILESVLYQEPNSYVNLLYGNKFFNSIIFQRQLDKLQKMYKNRFYITNILSAPHSDWSSFRIWTGEKGRINPETVTSFIKKHPPKAQSTEYYICGPENMNMAVQNTLLDLGIPGDQIHSELFGATKIISGNTIESVEDANLVVELGENKIQCEISKGKTILETLKEQADPPYSCESGICASCKAKLLKGSVHMKSRPALSDKEVQAGQILTCQAVPTSKHVEISYNEKS